MWPSPPVVREEESREDEDHLTRYDVTDLFKRKTTRRPES
jgi:hypothetical protein